MTAFTITASLEVAGRMRGATGLFSWIGRLPWSDPLVSSVLLSMLLFAVGGFGGAINASFSMNAMVHNTAWIQGHFHLTVGSAVALTFMGTSYWLVPKLTGRQLELLPLVKVQPYLWFVGMLLFSISNHITGLLGMPRRVFETSYGGSAAAQQWEALTFVSAIGGLLLFVSSTFFLLSMLSTVLAGAKTAEPTIAFADAVGGVPSKRTLLDRFGVWVGVAIVLVLIAYAFPLISHLRMETFGSPGFRPF